MKVMIRASAVYSMGRDVQGWIGVLIGPGWRERSCIYRLTKKDALLDAKEMKTYCLLINKVA